LKNQVIQVVQDTGYGMVSKTVTRNKNISLQAKGIYAYLCGFAGVSNQAYPSVKLMVNELGISKDTFYKYIKELTEIGVITVLKTQGEKGKFGHNIYQINEVNIINVENKDFQPCPKSPDTVEWNGENKNIENKPFYPCPKSPDTVTPDTVNQDTIINNNIINNSSSSSGLDKKFTDEVIKTWNSLKGLPKLTTLTKGTKRYKNLLARVKETSEEEVINAIKYIDCLGDWVRGKGDQNWTMTFEWAVLPNNFIKLHEKQYTNGLYMPQREHKVAQNCKNNINTGKLLNFDISSEINSILNDIK